MRDNRPKMGHYRPMSAPTSSGSGLAAAVVQQIKAERAMRDIPIGVLAKRANVSLRSMPRYMSGERELTFGQIERFAAALGMDTFDLIQLAQKRMEKV